MNNSEKLNEDLMTNIKTIFNSTIEIKNCNLDSTVPFESDKLCKIENVVSVFIDMAGSTNISIRRHQKGASKVFKAYIDSFVKIFDSYGARFIDIQGDGGFILFDGKTQEQRKQALASAIHTVNFISRELAPFVKKQTDIDLSVRVGIDFGTIFAKKFGRRNKQGSEYMNEKVWLGKPVSISSKLCNDKEIAGENTIRVSDRFFDSISKTDYTNVNHNFFTLKYNGSDTYELYFQYKSTNIPSIEKVYILETKICNNQFGFCSNFLK